MDHITAQVYYVQDSPQQKPHLFLDIPPVTREDRARVLGSRCGTPRFLRSFPHPTQDSAAAAELLDATTPCPTTPPGRNSGRPVTFEELPACSCSSPQTGAAPQGLSREGALGSRNGTPRRGRRIVTLEGDGTSLVLVARSSGSILDARNEVLGSKAGTPRSRTTASLSTGREARRCNSDKQTTN